MASSPEPFALDHSLMLHHMLLSSADHKSLALRVHRQNQAAMSLQARYRRLQVADNPAWRLCGLNQDYELCSSYPETLCFPAAVSDAIVRVGCSSLPVAVRFDEFTLLWALVWTTDSPVGQCQCCFPIPEVHEHPL